MDKNEKQWYFSCALQRQNRYLNMKEVLFNKLQRLKEETKYLGDNKPKFLRTLKSSIEAKKIVERSVYLCAEIALGRKVPRMPNLVGGGRGHNKNKYYISGKLPHGRGASHRGSYIDQEGIPEASVLQ